MSVADVSVYVCVCVLCECDTYFVLIVEFECWILLCCICSGYQNKHGYNCSWFVYTPLSSWWCSWAQAGAHKHTHTHKLKTTHIFNAQWLIKMLFPNSIENHFFNYNQNFFVQFNLKSFFFSLSLAHSLTLAYSVPFCRFFTSIWHCDSVIWCVIIAIQFIKYLFVSFWCVCFSLSLSLHLHIHLRLQLCLLIFFIFFWLCVFVYLRLYSSFSRFRGLSMKTCN